MMCKCGNLQVHSLRWCPDCGGEYADDPCNMTFCDVIMRQVTENPRYQKEDGYVGYLWWEALLSRSIGVGPIPAAELKDLHEQTLKEVRHERSLD